MEIYSFYQTAMMIAMLFTENEKTLLTSALIGGAAVFAILFVLQGFGLYKMAKNRGLKRKGLAFVPFVNIWYMGRLAGECNFFGQKVKRAGMYAMIAQIAVTLFSLATIAAEMYLYITQGAPVLTELGTVYWTGLAGFALTVFKFYEISGYILSIFQLVYEIFLIVLMMGLYKRYSPKNYFALSMLTLFLPASRFIIVFVLRNRTAIDYEAYMRARREAYMRQQQQYHSQYNPYGNPYQRPNYPYGQNPYGQNPYGQNPYGNGQNAAPSTEEPFEEFSSDKKGRDQTSGEGNTNADSDGFFD